MAGDWIKIEHATPDKPEVAVMAEILGIDPDAVVGKLVRLWIWADQQIQSEENVSRSCHAVSVTETFLNRVTYCDNFAFALKKVGWLEGESGAYYFKNFAFHNGSTAKKRGQSAKRQQKRRKNDVTQVSRSERDKNVTREEKSNKERESACAREVSIPTLQEITVAADRIGMTESEAKRFFEHYEGNNLWINQHGRLIKWQTKLNTWKNNERKYDGSKNTNGRPGRRIDNNAGTFNEGKTGQYATTKLGRVT